jgi:DNA-binding NarL/FixJ family response regulator
VRDDAAADDVGAILASAMRGEFLCSPRAAATLCHHVALLSRSAHADSSATSLSKRELQIAGLIDRGLSNKEIARRLGIQAATVKNHVHNILDKLKVHRRGEAAACLRMVPQQRSPAVGANAPSD